MFIDFKFGELDTIYNLVKDRQIEGSYFGNKKVYYTRLDSILHKIEEALDEE